MSDITFDCHHFRLAFFKAAYKLFEAEYYVKADDDIYLRPGIWDDKKNQLLFRNIAINIYVSVLLDRLATLLAKERTHSMTYIGCMKKGPVITDPKMKWYVWILLLMIYCNTFVNSCSSFYVFNVNMIDICIF